MKNLITEFFKRRAEKKARIKAKIESVLADYEKLLNEYRLIEEKKSELSYYQRQLVRSRVFYLVSKGHINVNKEQ